MYDDVQGPRGDEKARVSHKRRGLIAGAAALAVAALAARSSESVAAAQLVGTNNGATATDAQPDGVQGYTLGANNSGIFGRNNDLDGVGAWGEAPNGTGVFGHSVAGSGIAGSSTSGSGVFATSTGGTGVTGQITGGSAPNTIGIYGANLSTAVNSHGIIGLSTSGHGLVGTATGGSSYGGFSGLGTNGSFAGLFFGDVAVSGTLKINGAAVVAGPKSAAIQMSDGTHRLVYCVEMPDSWLEDIGEGTIEGGVGKVRFDPDFAEMVDINNYHVFLTEYDTHFHLSVTNRTADGFTVKADIEDALNKGMKATDLKGVFGWRMIAKRNDIEVERLAPFSMAMPEPDESLLNLVQNALASTSN